MDLEFDSAAVLYLLGAILGIAAVVYFGAEIVIALSPTVKAVLLVLGFVAFLAVGLHRGPDLLTLVAYVIAGATYVVFVGYTVTRFRAGADVTFLALAASSLLFIALGYLVRERDVTLTRRHVGAVLAVVLVVGLGLVAFDVTGPEPRFTMELADAVNVTAGEEVRVGTLIAHNPFVFSRSLDVPPYSACIYTDDGRSVDRLRIDWWSAARPNDLLRGGETRRFPVTFHPHPRALGWKGEEPPPTLTLEIVPVEQRSTCPAPAAVSPPRIVVVQGDVEETE